MLGLTVKDKITGFEGIVTGYVTYLSGCNQCLMVPPKKKDGALGESQWFDEQRLDAVKGKKAIVLDNAKGRGFDKAAPIR